MAQGMNIAEEGHIVQILAPIDITGGAVVCTPVNMENYGHCTIFLGIGVAGAASTVTVEEVATTGGVGVAIGFTYYAELTTATDVLGARTAVGVGGFATAVTNNIMYVIEIDAAELSDGFPWIELNLSNPGVSTIACAVAVLTGARYGQAESPTAIV